jgi:hypothetical protein
MDTGVSFLGVNIDGHLRVLYACSSGCTHFRAVKDLDPLPINSRAAPTPRSADVMPGEAAFAGARVRPIYVPLVHIFLPARMFEPARVPAHAHVPPRAHVRPALVSSRGAGVSLRHVCAVGHPPRVPSGIHPACPMGTHAPTGTPIPRPVLKNGPCGTAPLDLVIGQVC